MQEPKGLIQCYPIGERIARYKMNFAIQFLHERLLRKDTTTFQTTKLFSKYF